MADHEYYAVPDTDTALARARMLFSMLATPKLRDAFGFMLAEAAQTASSAAEIPAGIKQALAKQDWFTETAEVDAEKLQDVVAALNFLRGETAVLGTRRIERLPILEKDRVPISLLIAREVFRRVGEQRRLREDELNLCLSMLVKDVAIVRRDAVDMGLLERTPDGATYWLAGESR